LADLLPDRTVSWGIRGNPAFQIPIYDSDISFTDGAPRVGNLAGCTPPGRSPSSLPPKPEDRNPKKPLKEVQDAKKENRIEHKADDEPEDPGESEGRHNDIRKGIGNKDGAEEYENEGNDAPS